MSPKPPPALLTSQYSSNRETIVDEDLESLRSRFLNKEFDEVTFELEAGRMAEYSITCGETNPKFTDPTHDDFQAPPTFVSTLVGGRQLPGDFPRPAGVGMDAGKFVEWKAPIRGDVTLTGKLHLHDIYTKTGRTGLMIFLVTRMELFDGDTHVANAYTRTVIREKPGG